MIKLKIKGVDVNALLKEYNKLESMPVWADDAMEDAQRIAIDEYVANTYPRRLDLLQAVALIKREFATGIDPLKVEAVDHLTNTFSVLEKYF